MRLPWPARLSLVGLAFLTLSAVCAGFISPHDPTAQHRQHSWHPPQRIHVLNADGQLVRPFIYATERQGDRYIERPQTVPLAFWVEGAPYQLLGLTLTTHLVGTDSPEHPLFLLGTDLYGRDLLTRLLFGARPSLTVGALGVTLCLCLALLVGGLAGYLGGVTDWLAMRGLEVALAIPGLFLVLVLRPALGPKLNQEHPWLVTVLALAALSFAANARVIRGLVLSLKTQSYIQAAEAIGLSRLAILTRHLLPNLASFAWVTAALQVPHFILGEAALSFLGVGIPDPTPSWGNMLRDAQNLFYLTEYPWVLLPGGLILLTVLALNTVGDALSTNPRAPGSGL